jgi:phenylalanyl-tRNA synthetase alpha chain
VKEELKSLQKETWSSLSKVSTEKELLEIRVKVLGRKGSLTQLLKNLGSLPESERREIGKKANEVKEDLEKRIE